MTRVNILFATAALLVLAGCSVETISPPTTEDEPSSAALSPPDVRLPRIAVDRNGESRRPRGYTKPDLVWIVTFRDTQNEGDVTRNAAVLTTEREAVKVLHYLERAGRYPDLSIQAVLMHRRFVDWEYIPPGQ